MSLLNKFFNFFLEQKPSMIVRPFDLTMEEVVNKNKLKRESAIKYLGERWILHPNNKVKKIRRKRNLYV